MNQKTFNYFAWGIFAASVLLPVTVWGNNRSWDFSSLSLYGFFPLLGLLAWMIMWTHYVNGALQIKNPDLKKPKYYSRVTAYIVLGAILLHPGLLALAQFQNGQGLPPSSLYSYLGDAAVIAVMFGTISWAIFLSFEYFDRNRNKPWVKKAGLWISISQTIAMILIFIHALRIGGDLNTDWFYAVWLAYGALLLPCFYIIHQLDLKTHAALKK
jgi:fatty acid desaturase